MKVVDPSGRTWRVSRRWMPWRRKAHVGHWGDVPSGHGLGDDPISVILGIFLFILIIPFLVLAVLVALELLLLLLVLPFALLGRMLFGRHWHVEVRENWDFAWETEAGDWRQSGRAIEHIAEGLRRGLVPWQAASPAAPQASPHQPGTGGPPPGQPPPPPGVRRG
ncbi:hypothetical protein ACRTEC_05760 [Janibacter indicus]